MGDSAGIHRYVSFHERLKNVNIDLSRDASHSWGQNRLQVAGLDAPASVFAEATGTATTIAETSDLQSTAFGTALEQWNELNLSLPFQEFYAHVKPKAQSLVLLLHHRDEIATVLDAFLILRDDRSWLAWDALLDLVPRMAFDLGPEFLPVYPKLLTALLRASSSMNKNLTHGDDAMAARLVERAFHSAAWLFRAVTSLMLKSQSPELLITSWTIVRDVIAAEKPSQPLPAGANENINEVADENEGDKDEDGEENIGEGENQVLVHTSQLSPTTYTRRFATEALSYLIRKAPQAQLKGLVSHMLVDANCYGLALEHGIAATWANSCKTASHALHSRTPELLSCIMDLESPCAMMVRRIGRWIITSLVHHTRAPGMVCVFDFLLQRASSLQPGDALQSTLEWLIAAIGTRKGKRVAEDSLHQVLVFLADLDEHLPWTEAHASLLQSYTTLVCLSLPKAHVRDMTGPGKRLLQAFVARPKEEYFDMPWAALAGMFRVLGDPATAWHGFSTFALPHALEATSRVLEDGAPNAHQDSALALLSVLDTQGHLDPMLHAPPTTIVLRWIKRTRRIVQKRLEQLAGRLETGSWTDEATVSLPAVQLACRFPQFAAKFVPLLVQCIQSAAAMGLESGALGARSGAAVIDMSAVMGALVAGLVHLLQASDVPKEPLSFLFDGMPSTFETLLRACASNHAVLPALADLACIAHVQSVRLPGAALTWSMLSAAVLDANRAVVLAALRIMSLTIGDVPVRVMDMLVDVESMGLEVQTIATRNVKLRHIQREACKVLRADDVQMQALVYYTVGTLKINFQPVWAASRETLVALCSRVPEEVWRVSFAEWQAADALIHAGTTYIQDHQAGEILDTAMKSDSAFDDTVDTDTEDAFSLHDAQRQERVRWILRCMQMESVTAVEHARYGLAERSNARDVRLDVRHYADQLLRVYEKHAMLPEKHSEAFVSAVIAQWSSLVDDEAELELASASTPTTGARMPAVMRAERLRRFLAIFAEFRHPASMYKSPAMKSRFLALCANPELAIQRGAVECLLAWKDEWLVLQEDTLQKLLDPAKFRDTLSHLNLAASSEQFSPTDRPHVMQVLVRLLYGMMVSRRGARTSGAGQTARRSAILASLYESSEEDIGLLVNLMLGSFSDLHAAPLSHSDVFVVPAKVPQALPRKQLGLLATMGDVLRHLGRPLTFCLPRLVAVVVTIAAHANESSDATMRMIRRTAFRRLADFVRLAPDVDWHPFRTAILSKLIHPRLATFADDSVQAPSSLLDVCCAWVSRPDTLLCFMSDPSVLRSVYAGLSRPSIKPSVVHTILDMAERILHAGQGLHGDQDDMVDVSDIHTTQAIHSRVVVPTSSSLLEHIVPLVRHTIHSSFAHPLSTQVRDEMLRKQLSVLSQLAPHLTSSDDAAAVLSLLVPLMQHGAKAVPERVKIELLRTLSLLLPRASCEGAALDDLYTLFCRLGAELRWQPARMQYAQAFAQLAQKDASLERITSWVSRLNAYSARTLNEPDLETRLLAFDAILDPHTQIDVREWHALLYEALFFVMDEELVLRTNASSLIQRFVSEAQSEQAFSLATDVLLPGVYKRLHTRVETVRKELLAILGLAVAHWADVLPSLTELQVLRAGGDDEASVFTNMYHIQTHRRVRALHRLGDAAEAGSLRSRTLSELFVPLVWLFLLPNQSGGIDMNMANEALACIRRMATHLQWGHYYYWLKRFLRQLKEHAGKDETSASERLHVRGIVGVLEAFHFPMDEDVEMSDDPIADESSTQAPPHTIAHDLTHDAADARSLPRAQRLALATTLTTRVLPPLYEALATKDEDRLPARLPLLIGTARLAMYLPSDRRNVELFKVFSELGSALRSKLQSTRDTCRDMGVQMLRAIGASYLPDVVHELRRILTRGPQLAVCAYTLHTLLVALAVPAVPGTTPLLTKLDRGVRDMTEAVMEDLFGLTSEDRAAVEYKTKVRELRQSKSLDSFEHLARLVDPPSLQELLLPLRGVLATSIDPKTLHSVNECLHRIASGVSANPHIDTSSYLILCYTLIARGANALAETPPLEAPHLAQNAHFFVELGLDLLTTALRRSRFDIHDEATVSKLLPLVKAVGETLYARNAPVVERGLRAVAALARCPLPNLDETLPVMQKQMLLLLRHAGGIHSSMAQTTLRSLSVVLREGRARAPPARQLTELLNLVSSELDAPDAQTSVFALLRAIVSRAFVVPEIYDVMDRIAELLVTSHDAQVREICRSLYLSFLLDYPQGQGRLRSQLEFLAKHLAYESESGRRSVLDILGAIMSKFSTDVISQYSQLFFVALVMQLANEDSPHVRRHSADVLGTLLRTVHEKERDALLRMAKGWAMAHGSDHAQKLAAVALRVYDIAYAQSACPPWAIQDASEAISQALYDSAQAMSSDSVDPDSISWQLTYQALQTMQTIVLGDPKAWSRFDSAISNVVTLLTWPHAWCRVAASRVMGAYFAADMHMEANELIRTARQLVSQLYSAFLDDALTLQVVRNLVFLGKAFARGDAMEADDDEQDSDDDEDEGDVENDGEVDVEFDAAETLDANDNDNEHDDTHADDSEKPPPQLAWLFTKLSHAARLSHRGGRSDTAPQRVGAVLKWFAAMATQLSASITSKFLVHILSPIQRVMDDDQAPEDLSMLATEVQDLIQAQVGPTVFTRAFAHVKQARLDKRRERKHERLFETVMDPERAAKRRASRNAAKHQSRKRKHAHYRDKRQSNKRTKAVEGN